MRNIYISDIESKIIDRICEGHTHMSTLLIDHIPDLILDINTDNYTIQLILKKTTDQNELVAKATSQTERIIYILKFVIQLEQEGLVTAGYFAHGRVVESKWVTQKNYDEYNKNKNDYTHWNFTDHRMEEFIFTYADQTILPIPKLLAFKKRGYKTKEDKRHRETVRISIVGIIIALLFGVWSIYLTISTDSPTTQQIDIIIKELQQDQYPDSLQIRQQIDTLIKEIKREK